MRMIEFRKLVDAVIESHCGLDSMSLADFDLYNYWDDGLSDEECKAASRDAAIDLLVEEGFPFEEDE